jgi:AbrB family looped-hinge helix DNA binding protein
MEHHFRLEIQKGGRITIPVTVRRQLGLSIGDSVVLDLDNDTLRLRSIQQTVHDIQAMIKPYLPDNVSLVDELIQERRAEAAHEEAEYQQSAGSP